MNFFRATLAAVVIVVAALSISAPGGEKGDDESSSIRSFADLNDRPVGIMVGTVLDTVADKHLDYTRYVYFDDFDALMNALRNGEIDAFIGDYPVIRHLASEDPDLRALDEMIDYGELGDYGFAVRHEDEELYRQVNDVIERCKQDGTLERLMDKWFNGSKAEKTLPQCDAPPMAKDLRFGTCTMSPPFTSRNPDGSFAGLDLELGGIIAQELGLRLVIVDMDFGALIPSLLDNTVDVLGACLSITPERGKIIHFTDSYYHSGVGALVRDE